MSIFKNKSQDNPTKDIDYSKLQLHKNLKKNLKEIPEILGNSSDIVIREFRLSNDPYTKVAIIYLDGMTDKRLINDDIIKPIMLGFLNVNSEDLKGPKRTFEIIKELGISSGEIKDCDNFQKLLDSIFCGDTILLIDGSRLGLTIGSKGWENRGVTLADSEPSTYGPQESFTETLRINTSLLRRKIKHQDLRLESFQIGKYTKTEVNLVYIKEIASEEIINELKTRLNEY